MTAEEFRTRWTGHVPKVQDVTGEYAVLVPLVAVSYTHLTLPTKLEV